MENKWFGSWPVKCDFCHAKLDDPRVEYFVDGRTQEGPWALMCPMCHLLDGVGLGTGKGQKYDARTLKKLEG